ncbi:MAG: alpha/beta fold hydrolase [Pirellulales bacterium]|nr:alpha/beta fold hydrolase [Pirellulales bacterium]
MRDGFSFVPILLVVLALGTSVAAEEYHNADLPLLLKKLDGTMVATPEQWPARRAELMDLMCKHFIGSFPEKTPKIVEAQTLSEKKHEDGSLRRNVRLTFDTPNRVSFDIWVWVPKGDGPCPLMLTAPRFYQIGWAETALRRGYIVCLYPGVDSHHVEPAYPDYEKVWKTFHKEYPRATWTEISTKSWIAARALDYLVDPKVGYPVAEGQVGIIGFSRYGKQSMIAAAIDMRFTSVVARSPGSPGATPYRFASRTGFNEAVTDFPDEWFLQSLRAYNGREDELPMDAHAWAALIAPRNLLVHVAYNDDGDPTFGNERAYVEAGKVYKLLDAEDHYRIDYRAGGHCTGPAPNYITQPQQKRNIDWFDACFGRGKATRKDFPQEYIHQFDWNGWVEKLTNQEKQNPFSRKMPTDNADRRARIDWALGKAPKPVDYEGQYTFTTPEETDFMEYDRWQAPGTARLPVSFGQNVHGQIYYKSGRNDPVPVVIWLHPYSYPSGFMEGYGVEGTTVYHRLASAGYVVLAFDQVGFGLRLLEGRDFYKHHPKWSRLGRMVCDVRAALDFLVDGKGAMQGTMPKIDKQQIHVLGYSLGGMVALYSAAADDRIKSVASFCGFTPMRGDTSDKATGGIKRLWQWHALQPMLGLFDGRENEIPYDFDDVLALIAPRPCLIYNPRNDRHADFDDVNACVGRAKQFWEEKGAGESLTQMSPDDINRFQSAQQQVYMQWLGTIIAKTK